MATAAVSSANAPMPPPRTSSHRQTSPSASQSRRKGKESPRHQSSSSRAKPSPTQPTHSRSASAVGQPPAGTSLPREESAVINRIVVADPQEDIAREQARQAESIPTTSGAELTPITGLGLVGSEGVDDGGRGTGRSRQDHSQGSGKRSRFGSYILGQTLGEGEFGKVKMGWKKDSSVEVAIKLIRRETLGGNANRLQKIYREIHILRGLEHPNIVRLHEMVETERHIGIILEYASGGELFDYILNHRYLKDGAARRLFAQLISGVGYLHKKGIVHRDLKLENLLLDRNRNIIITDFGFANTFDPDDELGEDIEFNLSNKEFVKAMGLEGSEGARRGDLMQTSCGSPCYAAPELVVSDSLYTGRKVDVWSCGVILVCHAQNTANASY
jgi:protein-serine/threonine kinase